MIKATGDKRVLSAIVSLEHNEDFKTVIAWMTAELNKMREDNDISCNPQLSWNQGGCQAVASLLETFKSARDVMQSIESGQKMSYIKRSWT